MKMVSVCGWMDAWPNFAQIFSLDPHLGSPPRLPKLTMPSTELQMRGCLRPIVNKTRKLL